MKERLPQILPEHLRASVSKITLTKNLADAAKSSDIVQECGPEDLSFKTSLWSKVEKSSLPDALFWTSTTAIPASPENQHMQDKSRVIVVHPFNPPHPTTSRDRSFAGHAAAGYRCNAEFWRDRGRELILIRKEINGFVAGRLAWSLLREAIHLVNEVIVTVEELDRIIETSMGLRWAYAGPFKSFNMGGGPGGL